jgi:hypothetical protein
MDIAVLPFEGRCPEAIRASSKLKNTIFNKFWNQANWRLAFLYSGHFSNIFVNQPPTEQTEFQSKSLIEVKIN